MWCCGRIDVERLWWSFLSSHCGTSSSVPVTNSCHSSPMSCCFSSLFFFWAKAANLLNRPLPPLPDLEISKETIARVADALQIWLNLALFVAHDIAIEKNFLLCLQVVGVLWVISYIGSLFNFLNFDLYRCSSSLVFPWVVWQEPEQFQFAWLE